MNAIGTGTREDDPDKITLTNVLLRGAWSGSSFDAF
jgi:hypothetical protein